MTYFNAEKISTIKEEKRDEEAQKQRLLEERREKFLKKTLKEYQKILNNELSMLSDSHLNEDDIYNAIRKGSAIRIPVSDDFLYAIRVVNHITTGKTESCGFDVNELAIYADREEIEKIVFAKTRKFGKKIAELKEKANAWVRYDDGQEMRDSYDSDGGYHFVRVRSKALVVDF